MPWDLTLLCLCLADFILEGSVNKTFVTCNEYGAFFQTVSRINIPYGKTYLRPSNS